MYKSVTAIIVMVVSVFALSTCKKDKEEKIDPPIVKVFDAAITVNYTKASVSAEVTDQGGAEVKSKGFVYGLPNGSMDTVFCGSGTGIYSADLNNLQPNTTYVYEAFAKNKGGMGTSGKVTFTTRNLEMPTVKTSEVDDVKITTALCGGNVIDDGGMNVTQRGVCWSTNHNPTTDNNHVLVGSGTGVFSCTITDLSANTTYYIRAYAINDKGTAYGEEKKFTTQDYGLPKLITNNVTNITQTTAIGGGEVTDDGGLTVTDRGICWSSNHNPSINNHIVPAGEGLGSYTCNITGLNVHTTYYVRAYATNSKGTSYGDEVSFNTSASLPTISTGTISNITQTTAISGGNVTSDGGATVTAKGICWSSNQNPTIGNHHTSDGTGTGSFTSNLTDLTPGKTYYVRAYATNSVGTSYGEQKTFTTNPVNKPTVTTNNVTNITQTSATCGGNVTSDGGATVTARGICWSSTNQNPTISNHIISNGTGTGNFTSSITGLTAGKTYYVRAYATNSAGTSYGEQKTFTTNSVNKPTVTTNTVTNINQNSATCGGNVTADGGATVTARGVCWNTSQNPTISNSHTSNGSGTGNFTCNITGLTAGKTYYVRAYATNSVGTSYGEQKTFTTTSVNKPTVTTNDVLNVNQTSAFCGGNVTNAGGGTVTARGVCWNTSPNPTINNSHTNNGSGTGSFSSYITGLTPGKTYYVRAYATNSAGTGYGIQKTFTTESTLEGWLYYGEWNNHWQSWGLTNGGTKEWAVMFPTSILSQYSGTSITKVDTYIGETGSYTLKIYRGGTSQPTTLMKTQNFNVTTTGWNTVNISPITMVTTSTLWVSITTTHNAGQYPAGSCEGINNPNARWNNDNGYGWTDVYESNGNVDLCWEIQVWVTNQAKGEKGLEIQLPQVPASPQQTHEIKVSRNPHEGPKKYK
jgi:hypothetical protein